MKVATKAAEPFSYKLPDACLKDAELSVVLGGVMLLAYTTKTPGLIVTQLIRAGRPIANRWSVTHAPTGYRIDGFNAGMPLREARLIAGALSGFPIDWEITDRMELAKKWGSDVPLYLRHWVAKLKDAA